MEEILFMETQESMEREINLMELFWELLLGWRKIICFAVIFAILLGGVKYGKDMIAYRSHQNIDVEKIESNLTTEEQQQLQKAKSLMNRLKNYIDYQKNSVLIQMNPYEKPILELQYYIKSDYIMNYTKDNQRDYTDDIIMMYYEYITSGELKQNVINEVDLPIDEKVFSELIAIPTEVETVVTSVISITIAYPDKNKLNEISESIKAQLTAKESEFQQIGSHTLMLISESQNTVVDKDLVDQQTTLAKNINDCMTQLDTAKTDLTEQQLLLLDLEEKGTSNITIAVPQPTLSIKYMLLGAVLGIFFVCMWITCKMLFTAKLQTAEEIRNLYNIRLLGEITVSTNKKHFLSIIDKKILEAKNRKKKKLSMEQQIKLVAVNVALSCKQKEINSIYITGSEYENIDVRILDRIRRELSEQGIQVKEGGNIFYDAESLRQGTEIGTILFIEQKAQSIYDEISNELNLAKEQNNYILGAIVLI